MKRSKGQKSPRARTAPRAAKAKQPILNARLGFEEVGRGVGRTWQEDPTLLEIKIDGQPFAAQDLIASIDAAEGLRAPEEAAKKAYTEALERYNQAHGKRMKALDVAWRDFLFVHKNAKTTAEYSERAAEAFEPMAAFMREPAEKRKREKKRGQKAVKAGQ